MKRLLIILTFIFCFGAAKTQILSDAKGYIDVNITPNGANQITATKLNIALNKIMKYVTDSIAVSGDSLIWRINGTLYARKLASSTVTSLDSNHYQAVGPEETPTLYPSKKALDTTQHLWAKDDSSYTLRDTAWSRKTNGDSTFLGMFGSGIDATAWHINGDGGLTGSNFLGTNADTFSIYSNGNRLWIDGIMQNIGIGGNAFYYATGGYGNVSLGGAGGGESMTTGTGNTFIGYGAGTGILDENGNTLIGSGSRTSTPGVNYATAIGQNSEVGVNYGVVLGDPDNALVGIGTQNPTEKLHVFDGNILVSGGVISVGDVDDLSGTAKLNIQSNDSLILNLPPSGVWAVGAITDSIMTIDTLGRVHKRPIPTGNPGTVTTFSKTDGYGITSSVTNPTTTPNHTSAVDSAALSLKYKTIAKATQDSLALVAAINSLSSLHIVKQTDTANVTLTDSTTWFISNPYSVLTAQTLTMPANPVDGRVYTFSFGGHLTTTATSVVNTLTIAPNSGKAIIGQTVFYSVQTDDKIAFRYNSTNSSYYRQ